MFLIKKEPIKCDIKAFNNAINLFIDCPRIVRKGICSCEVVKWGKLRKFDEKKLLESTKHGPADDSSWFWENYEAGSGDFKEVSHTEPEQERTVIVVVNKILPKNVQKYKPVWTISFVDHNEHSVLMCRYKDVEEKALLPHVPYKIQYDKEFISILMSDESDIHRRNWLEFALLPKLIKMIKNFKDLGHKSPTKSLALIDPTKYYQIYSQLKQKYGAPLIQMWTEVTDPQKYVYEDLAIASYLLLLWQRHSKEPQTFVDLGCGNGLLVYILSSEGHIGTGIDVRKRKIWDVYPTCDSMTLKMEAVTPSDSSLFPDADWIIGNHSDELSPWIPVIAARSSYQTRFFLLPCCAYEFDGQKYRRSNSSKSVYEDFLEYVQKISKVCGFTTETDRLAIPSTKRLAIVGVSRVYAESETDAYSNEIKTFIDERINLVDMENTNNAWVSHFKPREAVERVKNCTRIDKSVVFRIVLKVFNELLSKKRIISEYPTWNAGGSLLLSSAMMLLSDAEKQVLKQESGGLQTLLKNHSSVFQVRSGQVSIQVPKKYKKGSSKEKYFKKAQCWFVQHHPNGCPLNDSECSYSHDILEKLM